MGVVYEAYDRLHGETVALKLLPNATPERRRRFKREFRAVAELRHPNLVRLGELVGSGEHWFFTMELVPGTDIVSYVRGRSSETELSPSLAADLTNASVRDSSVRETLVAAAPLDGATEERLRECLAQLSHGLAALHAAGLVHRDVKPSNVLVTPTGRVVLLDFGLASLTTDDTTQWGAGTPLYMAPEQSVGPVTAAADWYAFGALTFELLTDTLPFRGSPEVVLLAKQGGTAPRVRARNAAAPEDLAQLCDALLAPDPTKRPSEAEILATLEESIARPSMPPFGVPPPDGALIGRDPEWRELAQVFEELCRDERPQVVSVRGDSGIGKTALVRKFAESLASSGRALVFSGRCHERERVPYKAIDDIADGLSSWLRQRRDADVEALLPQSAGVIARAFPVLARVRALARARQPALAVDPQEMRAHLFAATRELFINIARVQPLVLVIDDLHWADLDSLAMLEAIFGGEGAARLLLLCTARTTSFSKLPERLVGNPRNERGLTLGLLTESSSAELATQLLKTSDVRHIDAGRLANESGGHPLFLCELVRQLASPTERPDEMSLDGMLAARIAGMSEGAVRVLGYVAIAGAPLAASVLKEAVALSAEMLADARHELRSHGFLHSLGEAASESLDVSHDRVRQAVLRTLDEAGLHLRHAHLAQIFERAGEPAASAVHWRAAAEPARAAGHYLRAAEIAVGALAFGDAVDHYAAALDLGDWTDAERLRLSVQLAEALENAGRGAAAAAQYRAAAEASEPRQALELKRRAAGQLMRSGYLDEGLGLAREVLSAAGIRFARFPLISMILRRVFLIGRLERERRPRAASTQALERIDLCWSLSSGLVVTDHTQGAYLQTRGLALAMRSGDPYRVARALAAEAALYAGLGARAQSRVLRLIDRADGIAEQLAHPQLMGTVALMAGIAAHLGGRFSEAKSHLERASTLFRERCTGVAWELDACRQFWLESIFYLGDLSRFPGAVLKGLDEAEARGSIYAQANLRTGLPNALWLMRDDPDRAERECDDALSRWSGRGFHVQHWYRLIGLAHVELYRGLGNAAHRRLEQGWTELEPSHLLRLSHTRIVALHLRARTAVAAAAQRPAHARGELLSLARRLTRSLEREKMAWASALSAAIVTGIDALEGRPPSATRLGFLRAALDRGDLRLYTLALETLRPDVAESAGCGLARYGVRDPQAFARMLIPGLV